MAKGTATGWTTGDHALTWEAMTRMVELFFVLLAATAVAACAGLVLLIGGARLRPVTLALARTVRRVTGRARTP